MDKISTNSIKLLTSILLFFLLFLYGIIHIMPNNPIKNLPLSEYIHINTWFPQGWGFYSKNPRDITFKVVNIDTGESAVQWPNNRVDNAFGLYRKGRSQGIEVGRLSTKVASTDWKEIEGDPLVELKKMKAISVENDSPKPTVHGDIGIIYQEPIPWNWAKNKNLQMPSKIVRLDVK